MKSILNKVYLKLPIVRDLHHLKMHMEHSQARERLKTHAAAIQALEAIKAGNERYRDPKRLLVYGAQYFSQNFEDGMIAEIFRRIGTSTRTFVEIGIGDGSENNTSSLLSRGWSGWWLDGDPDCIRSIESRLKQMPETAKRLKVSQAFVSPENISEILTDMGVPADIDLLSLDIDLNTYHLWDALGHLRPRVAVIEYNAAFPPNQAWVHPYVDGGIWDYTQEFGASLKAYELLGRKFGYSLVGCDITGINAFFVRDDLVGSHFEGPHTAENHYEPPRYSLTLRHGHRSVFFVENGLDQKVI